MANNFISLYPTHQNVDYAYYMKGVAMFEKKRGRLAKFISGGNKKIIRDPQGYRNSQSSFEELIKRYPESKYACLLYTSPSPRDQRGSRMPSSA